MSETTESIGLEISAMIREADRGATPDGERCLEALERMMASDAQTAKDTLAMLTLARRFLEQTVVPHDTDEADKVALGAACALVRKSVGALESLTGTRAGKFEGEILH